MSIILRFKSTTGAGSNVLDAGEIAVNTFDKSLHLGNGSVNTTLVGAPIPAGTAASSTLRWDNSGKTYVEDIIWQQTATGPNLIASGILTVATGGLFNFGAGIGKVDNTASIFRFTVADAATVDFIDSGQTRMQLKTDGDLTISGTTFWNAGTEFNKDFTRMRKLTQLTYDGLTPDANTLYFITA